MPENYKKKKKRSFFQMFKKHARSGNYGKGNQLEEGKYNYYIRIFEQLKQVENEDKDILIKNFFRELLNDENVKVLIINQLVSRILDDTLPLASFEAIISIIDVFNQDLRMFCVDPYASHVLQTLLIVCLKHIQICQKKQDNERKTASEEERGIFKSFIVKTSKFVYNNLSEFVCDMYASHVTRTVLEVCSGIEVGRKIKSSERAQVHHTIKSDPKDIVTSPEEMVAIVRDISVRLTQLPDITNVIKTTSTSAVLQTCLAVLTKLQEENLTSELITHILHHGFDNFGPANEGMDGLHPLFENQSTSRIMDVIVEGASPDLQLSIFKSYFYNSMDHIMQHPNGVFALQKLLASWKDKGTFSELYTCISSCLEVAFTAQRTGVILAFVQACRRLSYQQSSCLKAVMKILKCKESEDKQLLFAPLLLHLIPHDSFMELKNKNQSLPPVSLHGSIILQEMLNFKKPIKVVKSVIEMHPSELVRMACDPRGSHVIDAFCDSQYVGEASRVKLLAKFTNSLTTLACNKHGSRSLEALWNSSGVKHRAYICQELYESSKRLRENQFGQFIYRNFQIEHFNSKERKDWEQVQMRELKKRELLTRFLDETVNAPEILEKSNNESDLADNNKSSKKFPNKIIEAEEEEHFQTALSDCEYDIEVCNKKTKKNKRKRTFNSTHSIMEGKENKDNLQPIKKKKSKDEEITSNRKEKKKKKKREKN